VRVLLGHDRRCSQEERYEIAREVCDVCDPSQLDWEYELLEHKTAEE
jgi:hypothetical protein